MEAVILTKSYKKDKFGITGWCVVAFDLENHILVRFVDENGTGIPKTALDDKGINILDKVNVRTICRCPEGPQTENILVDTASFSKISPFTPGIGKIMRMVPELPLYEPKFMDDCRYKYMDASQFHHSVEIIEIYNLRIFLNQYNDKRLCEFDTMAGHNNFVRITVPEDYYKTEDWKAGDHIAIMTIPKETWKVEDKSVGYFKFVAALYPVPPSPKQDDEFIERIHRDPFAHPYFVNETLKIPHIDDVEPHVRKMNEEAREYRNYCHNLLWKTRFSKAEKQQHLIEKNVAYNKTLSALRNRIEEIIGYNL